MDLTDLPGVGPVAKKRLNDAGITDVMDLIVRSEPDLADITKMDRDACGVLLSKARKYLQENNVLTDTIRRGGQVKKDKEDHPERISLGDIMFNELLNGGFEPGYFYHLYGENGCGKTQVCHTISVLVQKLKSEGGLSDDDKVAKTFWIDSENTFRHERITQIAENREMDPDETLDNIIHGEAQSAAHQQLLAEKIPELVRDENVKLVVVDSGIGLFRSEYLGRGTLADRQQRINKFVSLLSNFAKRLKIVVVFTNQITADPSIMYGDPTKPTGGNIVGHIGTFNLYLRKAGKKRAVKLEKSTYQPYQEAIYDIDDSGIIDYVEKKK